MIDVKSAIERGFRDAPFVAHLGIELDGIGEGWCEASLVLADWHLQQTGVAHAGVVATFADHCAGAAASTQLAEGEHVVSVEFKINLLRGAKGERLRCRADVLKGGRTLVVSESQVYAESSGRRELVAKLTATLAVIRPPAGRPAAPKPAG
jgi:uncharacterized protein (TIGR00369 family)